MWITITLTNGTTRQINSYSISSLDRWNGITRIQYGMITLHTFETVDEVEVKMRRK